MLSKQHFPFKYLKVNSKLVSNNEVKFNNEKSSAEKTSVKGKVHVVFKN